MRSRPDGEAAAEQTPLRKNQLLEAEIVDFSSEGAGVARTEEGAVLFVPGGVPGDRAELSVTRAGKGASYGRIVRLIRASDLRAESDCSAFPRCGGCAFRHVLYEGELAFKKKRVEDAIRRIGGLALSCEEIIGAEETERCRGKAVVPVGFENGRPVMGFYQARSHRIIPMEDCLLQPDTVARAGRALLRYLEETKAPVYNEETGKGLVRRLFVRVSRAKWEALIAVSAAGRLPEEARLAAVLRDACPEAVGIVLNINRSRGNKVLGERCVTLWGRPYIEDVLLGKTFRVSALSFFQVNPAQAEKLYQRAIEYAGLTGKETVLDLYCGAGTVTLCMAPYARRVIGAEIVEAAVKDGEENIQINGADNVRLIHASAADAARMLLSEGIRPDVITVDPPRKGMDSETVEAIRALAPRRVVYISCDPATLARDLSKLSDLYVPLRLSAVDMFPRTSHIETVCLLSKLSDAKHHVEVELNLDEMDLTSAESKATYEEIKAYVREHAGLNVSKLYIAQTKRKCGIIERENYNLPKSEDSRQPQCPPEKGSAIKEALKHFGMI